MFRSEMFEGLPVELKKLAVTNCPDSGGTDSAGQQADLANTLARRNLAKHSRGTLVPVMVRLHPDLQPAAHEKVERIRNFALVKQPPPTTDFQ